MIRRSSRALLAPVPILALFALAATIAVLSLRAARAQLLDSYFPQGIPGFGAAPGVTIATRQRPEYDYPGIHAGGFLLHPTLDESLGYVDNPLGAASNARGSAVATTDAAVQASSNWSRNQLGGAVGIDDQRYLSLPNLDQTNWNAGLGGAYQLGEDQVSLAVGHAETHQNPSGIDSGGFDVPIPEQENQVRASVLFAGARVSLTPGLVYATYRFGNTSLRGTPVLETYRNRDILEPSLTLRYALSPLIDLVAVLSDASSTYVNPHVGYLTPRSNGVSALAGIDYQGSGLWRLRALLGYEQITYAGSAIPTHASPIAEVDAIWTPTGLTSVKATLSRTIEDAGAEDTVGYTYTQGQVAVDHELRRNVLLHAYAGVQHADYLQSAPPQTVYAGGVGVTWLLNRYARVVLSYDASRIQSTASSSYSQNTVMLSLKLGHYGFN